MASCKYCLVTDENEGYPFDVLFKKNFKFGDVSCFRKLELGGLEENSIKRPHICLYSGTGSEIIFCDEIKIKYCPMCGRKL